MSMPLAAEVKRIRSACAAGKKLVFVSGSFNILHPGHLRLLRFAAECGDMLVVGVFANQLAASAYLDEADRLEAVRAVGWVAEALLIDVPPEQFIAMLRPDVVVKGKEHENGLNPEKDTVEAYGGRLLFGSGDTTFSSISLLREEVRRSNRSSIVLPEGFVRRHGCGHDSLMPVLERMGALRVAVVGDAIMDEYVTCDPLGMSQEDPTIVVTPVHRELFVGGAGIVAAHAKGVGAGKVHFFSVTGADAGREQLVSALRGYGVDACLIVDESRPTTLKQRFRASGKTLLRVNHLRQHQISPDIQKKLWRGLERVLPDIDVLIFSDFNYGVLPQKLVDRIIAACQERDIMMVADSQCSSQVGDVSRFHDMAFLTPTEREARIAMGNHEDGLVVLAESLRRKARAGQVIVTLGAEGVLVHAGPDKPWITDRIPAMNRAPMDVAGAGDSLFVVAAMSLRAGASIWQSAYLGSLAAACQVGRIGNLPLSARDLTDELSCAWREA
ncbi:MAG: adenylyltransferase/cytidyltransferase family protein [Rhodocyclales bacterium]|nr:adenylyltransferase/cytidyltransferase family protein [Rhodocyclales bacterium]